MRHRRLTSFGIFVLAAAAAATVSVAGQTGKPYTPSKTADGQPDIQGVWDFRTVTPIERPKELGNKEFLTAAEAKEYEKAAAVERDADQNRQKTATARGVVNGTEETNDVALAYNQFWWDRGTNVIGTLRTSLVIDPKDGRIPPRSAEAQKRFDEIQKIREGTATGPEDRSVGERCIMGFNAGPPMTPGGYNQNVQIVQSAGYVSLLNEMVHNVRIVPLDGRPHIDASIRQWSGDSRGRWDGNTLVIDTTNYNAVGTSFTNNYGSSQNMHLVERFTKTDANTLVYEFTVDDPSTWARSWTLQLPMRKSDLPIYEYACHEGNYGMFGLLSGARAVDKNSADAAKKGSN
jgi:hypothetical protein